MSSLPSFFGDPLRGPVWASELSGRVSLPVGGDQLVCLCHLAGDTPVLWPGKTASPPGTGLPEYCLHFHVTGAPGSRLRSGPDSDAIAIGFHLETIRKSLSAARPGLVAAFRDLLFGRAGQESIRLELPERLGSQWVSEFRNPPVTGPARTFWFEAKIREFIAVACFQWHPRGAEFFCSRQKRLAQSRVTQTKKYLSEHLDEALDLAALARSVGCSGHYLSRTFSEHTGATISQHLRRLRIERAAELLASGRFNVSEAAIEVGYQSLSHFSKAFLLEKGCLPSKYDRSAA